MNYYSEQDINDFVKINLALIEKFKDQLNAEYGTSFMEISDMFQKLYEEQNEKMGSYIKYSFPFFIKSLYFQKQTRFLIW